MRETYQNLLKNCEKMLEEASVPNADWDAWLLFEYCFHVSRTKYFLERSLVRNIDEESYSNFIDLTEKRAKRIPLQHLLGETEFMGLPFLTNASVLIPRQDTETLVETVLAEQKKDTDTLLDLCTGSGCIAISLAHYGKFQRVDASDYSNEAIETARKNVEKNHSRVHLLEGDLFENIKEKYDVIVSNPPYIADDIIETLEPEVRLFEPYMALSGGKDGLFFYRQIAARAGDYLRPDGRLYLEIGYDQSADVTRLLEEAGFFDIKTIKDLSGMDRVIRASWRRNKESV